MSKKSDKISFTVDEIISTLNHSSLPAVVIEGKDDIVVFRQLEEKFANLGLSVFGAGGRKSVLEIFKRRHEISNGQKLIFIADQDTWVITGIPDDKNCDELLFTSGYSIENDIFQDGDLENLMSRSEKATFSKELSDMVEWYALALNRMMEGEDSKISKHPNEILASAAAHAAAIKLKEGEAYPYELRRQIHEAYASLLRGKTLIALLMRQLSYTGRTVRHNHLSLFEMVANKPGRHLTKIFEQVEQALG